MRDGVRTWAVRIALALALLGVGLAALLAFVLYTHVAPPVDPDWAVEGDASLPPGSLTVRYTGTATLVFSDGETLWMTDGWFTRPGPLELLFGEIAPDPAAIERGLARNGVERAAAVIPLHSHYDHAMDAPEVAIQTGALVLGSKSTANIARGWGLPEERIRVLRDREPVALGRFRVTPIASRHFEFPDPRLRERALADPDIREPLVPPVSAFDYKVGTAWVLHVAHPLGRFLVVGTAGFLPGALDGVEADVVFLGVGGLGAQSDDYREDFWRETIGATRPTRIVPIHWDSLSAPIEGPFVGPARIETLILGGGPKTREFLEAKRAANPHVRFLTLPRYDEVVLFPAP